MITITVVIILVLVALLIFFCFFKKLKRVTSLKDLPSDVNGIELSGIATYVFDGDGFKFFHVPCCRSSTYTTEDKKVTVRLAGIDAPESASMGNPGQPFANKSKHELMNLVLGKKIKIKLLGIDRYNRLLAMCYEGNWLSPINVNMKMVEIGMACVYKGGNAVYDDCEDEFNRLEAIAKQKRLGIWSQDNYISPMDYKKMIRK